LQSWNFTSLEQQRDDVIASFKASDVEIARRIGSDDFPIEGDKPDPALWVDLRERERPMRTSEMKRILQGAPGYRNVACQG
jgi:hypothetical protein